MKTNLTLEDIAEQAGVSRSTVSRVINEHPNVRTDVRKRVLEVIRKTGYHPHTAARQLASRKTRIIGLIHSNFPREFFLPLLTGVETAVYRNGYNLLVATHYYQTKNLVHTPPPIGPHNTDGLLIFVDGLADDELFDFHARGFPMVLIHRTSPAGITIPSVTVENVISTKKMIQHLIRVHGRSRIIFMRGPEDHPDSVLREASYKSTLEMNGIQFDERLILNGGFVRDIAFQSLDQFLSTEKKVEFDAVYSGSDNAAIGVLRALRKYGVRVPEDVSVVGFDDLSFAPLLNPPLTTVRAPTESVGRIATEQLFRLLDNQPVAGIELLPTEIIFRRSCGCQF